MRVLTLRSATNYVSTIVLRVPSSPHAHRQICPLCPSTQTSSPHHCHSPGAMWIWVVPYVASSRHGRVMNVLLLLEPGTCHLNWVGRASLALMVLTQSSTAKQ